MGGQIIKVSREDDLYMEWSSIVEAPTWFGDPLRDAGLPAWQRRQPRPVAVGDVRVAACPRGSGNADLGRMPCCM